MAIIKWHPQASNDMEKIDHSIRIKVFKTIEKLKLDPVAYGNPLGNQSASKLMGFYKITPADGFRIVYTVLNNNELVIIAVVGKRANAMVYKTASKRIATMRELIDEEFVEINKLLSDIEASSTK